LFLWELRQGADLMEARTVAVNVFVIGELFYLFKTEWEIPKQSSSFFCFFSLNL